MQHSNIIPLKASLCVSFVVGKVSILKENNCNPKLAVKHRQGLFLIGPPLLIEKFDKTRDVIDIRGDFAELQEVVSFLLGLKQRKRAFYSFSLSRVLFYLLF